MMIKHGSGEVIRDKDVQQGMDEDLQRVEKAAQRDEDGRKRDPEDQDQD